MTIDYCENRLDGIVEAGEWLIDCAVEAAIKRNDWIPPKPAQAPPSLDQDSLLMRGFIGWMQNDPDWQRAHYQALLNQNPLSAMQAQSHLSGSPLNYLGGLGLDLFWR